MADWKQSLSEKKRQEKSIRGFNKMAALWRIPAAVSVWAYVPQFGMNSTILIMKCWKFPVLPLHPTPTLTMKTLLKLRILT